MSILFISTKFVADFVMEDQSRKRRHDPEKKKLKKATKRARKVAKDENLKLAMYRARVQMLERPGADPVEILRGKSGWINALAVIVIVIKLLLIE